MMEKSVKKLNLRSVPRRTKNMSGEEVVVNYGSFKGLTPVLGTQVIDDTCVEAKLPHNRPNLMSVALHPDDPGALIGTPTMTEDESTTRIRRDEKGNQYIIEMFEMMELIKFQVPVDCRARIPISRETISGYGPSVVFHFSQAKFEAIEKKEGSKSRSRKRGVQARATMRITSGSQATLSGTATGTAPTHSSYVATYQGDLDGQGVVEEVTCFYSDSSAVVTAVERFTGRIGPRFGSFVFEHQGRFENGFLNSKRTIVPGSGTGDLARIQGEIIFQSGQAEAFPVSLRYYFA